MSDKPNSPWYEGLPDIPIFSKHPMRIGIDMAKPEAEFQSLPLQVGGDPSPEALEWARNHAYTLPSHQHLSGAFIHAAALGYDAGVGRKQTPLPEGVPTQPEARSFSRVMHDAVEELCGNLHPVAAAAELRGEVLVLYPLRMVHELGSFRLVQDYEFRKKKV